MSKSATADSFLFSCFAEVVAQWRWQAAPGMPCDAADNCHVTSGQC